METLTYLQANESNGCPLHTTCFRHNCEERGRWSWCLICPAAKHRENSLEISPVFKICVWQPFCKDISNNTQQLPGRTVLQISFNYVLKYIFSLVKNCIHWAVHLRIGSRLAPLQAWPVCLHFYRSLREATVCQLATLGKVKGKGVALRFSNGFWFSYPKLVFLVSSHQLLGSLAGRARNRRLHLQLFSPRRLHRRPGYVSR